MSLTFGKLNLENVRRCELAFHSVAGWTPTDWATAVAGEVGEACNLISKWRRGEPIDAEAIADELADAVIYCDLLCARLGESLEAAIVRKFNEVSDRRAYPVKLSEDGER